MTHVRPPVDIYMIVLHLRSTADGYGGRDGRTDGKGGGYADAQRTPRRSRTPLTSSATRSGASAHRQRATRAAARGLEARRPGARAAARASAQRGRARARSVGWWRGSGHTRGGGEKA
eukprot:1961917-Prymnesium_polylepis.1